MYHNLVKMPEVRCRNTPTATESKMNSFKSRRFTRQPDALRTMIDGFEIAP